MRLNRRTMCPFCNNNQFKLLYKKEYNSFDLNKFLDDYYKNPKIHKILISEFYEIAECNKCKGLFQSNIPDEELSLFIYEELISSQLSFKKKLLKPIQPREYIFDAKIIEKLFRKKNNEVKILEFGSGWGFWARFMKSKNFNVETVEISNSRIKYLKETKIHNYTSLTQINKKYDLIFSNQVLEHIPFPLETIKQLKTKLFDNGIMYHKFPSSFLFKKKLSKNYIPQKDCAHPLEHINIFNKNCLNEICKILDLKQININNLSIIDNIRLLKNNLLFNQIILRK